MRRALTAPLPCAPRYGYQLRAEFEARTGATWPLNVGQVYTALARLERDGLVAPAAGSGERSETQVHYRITDAVATRSPSGSRPRSSARCPRATS